MTSTPPWHWVPQQQFPSVQEGPQRTVEELLAEQHDNRIKRKLQEELERREVKRLANAEEVKDNRKPVRRSLREELALPDPDEIYAIDELLPISGNALFAGKYKAGKTTFNANLLRSWADGEPFLGRFRCQPDPEKPVATIFNYEMSENQFRRWLRRFNIKNLDNIHIVQLRGLSLPLALPEVREEIAGWLHDANTGLWIVDPASRAIVGSGDGGDNSDVAAFTSYLDEIKLKADVRELILNIHMPHGANQDKDLERAIGAQAWSAWADALWYVTRDGDGVRWFSAYGRDVEIGKMLVQYDESTMGVTLRETDPEALIRARLEEAIVRVVRENPGASGNVIKEQSAAFCQARRQTVLNTIHDLVQRGVLYTQPGPRNSSKHYLSTSTGSSGSQ